MHQIELELQNEELIHAIERGETYYCRLGAFDFFFKEECVIHATSF